ncbi:helix-turn-helix domain-containing protein [Sphingomonas sp. BIUV-7]|uniref:Helix-turn-helix domain-containing protein n=1 Tax=Sphingomonas natans TaxID=3063330 RepID=A0ABT8YAT2_9SPHN|nr:helix-turn-helix domain-containing protein [Sphingomonas sp. BIUV-7]MDO6415431.1 helix-turn-helix domain-containing protein [Sphingomonas sp. BIUV-7]
MALHPVAESYRPEKIEQLKSVSGRMIEERRKRARMTQSQLAGRVGIGVRWLREIESGNPKSAIENHLRCAFALGLNASHLFIPLMFMENGMKFPLHLLLDDPSDLNRRCVEFIGNYYVEAVTRQLRPTSGDPSRLGAA